MSYTVTRSHGCIAIDGAIPLMDMAALLECWSKRDEDDGLAEPDDVWMVDGILANALRVNLVCGPLHATRAWRELLSIGEKIE